MAVRRPKGEEGRAVDGDEAVEEGEEGRIGSETCLLARGEAVRLAGGGGGFCRWWCEHGHGGGVAMVVASVGSRRGCRGLANDCRGRVPHRAHGDERGSSGWPEARGGGG